MKNKNENGIMSPVLNGVGFLSEAEDYIHRGTALFLGEDMIYVVEHGVENGEGFTRQVDVTDMVKDVLENHLK